jgi:DHA1 family bicyclomycin/chloramphenicol resistance-like MFS transporter
LNPPQTPTRLVVLLGALVALTPLGTDLYAPSLPAIAQGFGVAARDAQFTLTTFFIGIALGQLVWGPLSDRFGRKPVLLAGLSIMLVTALGAVPAQSVGEVAALRLAQGLGMSSGPVLGRAMVRDLYSHEQAARLLSAMAIVFSIVPIAAPLAGAGLAGAAGWQAVFWCIATIAVILIVAVAAGLAETAPAERRSVHPARIGRTFAGIITDRRFLVPYSIMFSAQCGIIGFVSASAFALVREGVSTFEFGLMFAAVMLGQISGAWSSSRLVVGIGIARMLRLGSALMLAAGFAAAALAWAGVWHWLAIVLPFMVFLYGTALIIPNATAAALSPFPQAAGAASSLIGALGFTGGALVSIALGAAFDGTPRALATAGLLSGLAAFCCERFLLRGKA